MIKKMTNKLSLSKIFLGILVSFLMGIFLGGFFDSNLVDFNILVVSIILLIMITIIYRKEKSIKTFGVWAIFIIVGLGHYLWFNVNHLPKNLPFDKEIEFIGTVVDEPDVREITTKLTLKVEDVTNTNKQGIDSLIGQKVLVTVERYPEYNYGDKLKISGELKEPGIINDFDYRRYLSKDKVFSIIIHPTNVEYIEKSQGNRFYAILYSIKNYFEITINKILSEPMAGLLEGLLLGVKKNIPQDLLDAFSKTGTTHIIAVSGFNVMIIVRAFERLSKHWSKNLSFILGSSGLLSFVILTGAEASVTRAAIMAFMFLLAHQLGRKSDIIIAVTFVACIMIILNPFILRADVGFQLSFLAVLGLVYLSPIFDKVFVRLPKIIKEPLSATLGAQLAVLPIVLSNFDRLSLVSPLANVLILEVIPWAMLSGFMAAALGMIFLPLGQILGWGSWVILKYIIVVAQYCAKLPYASAHISLNNWYWIVLFYILLIIGRIKISKIKS